LRTGYVVLRAGAIGPHFLTNGEPWQCANTRDLVLGVPLLIEFATCFYTLYPGDPLYAGTKARAR
jgi:2-keto-4-pentenoate hydratase/2-oxohepta-3-ene-1,7-dioic acid hydratase in catechol pathway